MTFNNKTIDELHDLLVKKEISATELTKATLEDIKSREGAVDAFLTITEDAALAQVTPLMKRELMRTMLWRGFLWQSRTISLLRGF